LHLPRGPIDNVRWLGVVLPERPRELARRQPRVGDLRGKGLLASLELVGDRKSQAALVPANTDSSLALPLGGA
jgi:4-aminobutyrate aminotransferase-like enzyme